LSATARKGRPKTEPARKLKQGFDQRLVKAQAGEVAEPYLIIPMERVRQDKMRGRRDPVPFDISQPILFASQILTALEISVKWLIYMGEDRANPGKLFVVLF
jgi:hypothetical protein